MQVSCHGQKKRREELRKLRSSCRLVGWRPILTMLTSRMPGVVSCSFRGAAAAETVLAANARQILLLRWAI